MLGLEYPLTVGLLASLPGAIGQSVLWYTVGAGLLLGVMLQIAASVVALYLVFTSISAPRLVRHHRTGGTTGGVRGGVHGDHVTHLAPA